MLNGWLSENLQDEIGGLSSNGEKNGIRILRSRDSYARRLRVRSSKEVVCSLFELKEDV